MTPVVDEAFMRGSNFKRSGTHYNYGKGVGGEGYTCPAIPRLYFIAKSRGPNVYFVDGVEVPFDMVNAALAKPVEITEDEQAALDLLGDRRTSTIEFRHDLEAKFPDPPKESEDGRLTDVTHNRAMHILHFIQRKGLVETYVAGKDPETGRLKYEIRRRQDG